MQPKDLYIKLSDPAGKTAATYHHHRVWDADKFIAILREQHEYAKKPEDCRHVAVISRAEYQNH